MTLEEIESMELTDELIEQVRQATTAEALALAAFMAARMLLDDCGGGREAAVEEAQRYCQAYALVYGSRPQTFPTLLKAIGALADFRAKKAANPHTDQSKGLTAHNTPETGCQSQHTTKTDKAQGVGA